MDVRYLNYILMLSKTKNMTKAANALYVSQSSLSQYLAKLEQELGTPLFIRNKGELTLTEAGHLYVTAANEVVLIQKKLYQSIQDLNNRGHISVGATSQWGLRMLTEIIPQFKKDFSDVTIEISEDNIPTLREKLEEESIDCALMSLSSLSLFAPEQLDVLRKEEVFFAVPKAHPYYCQNQGQPISGHELIQAFKNESFIMPKKGSSLYDGIKKIFSDNDFEPVTVCQTNSIPACLRMIAAGISVSFIAESCISDTEHIVFYSLKPKLYRYNAFVRRKNWLLNAPENTFYSDVKSYFS